jgi:hypothetical protein
MADVTAVTLAGVQATLISVAADGNSVVVRAGTTASPTSGNATVVSAEFGVATGLLFSYVPTAQVTSITPAQAPMLGVTTVTLHGSSLYTADATVVVAGVQLIINAFSSNSSMIVGQLVRPLSLSFS